MVGVAAAALLVVAARTPLTAAIRSILPAAMLAAVRRARAKPIPMPRSFAGLPIRHLRALNPHIESRNDAPATVRPPLISVNGAIPAPTSQQHLPGPHSAGQVWFA